MLTYDSIKRSFDDYAAFEKQGGVVDRAKKFFTRGKRATAFMDALEKQAGELPKTRPHTERTVYDSSRHGKTETFFANKDEMLLIGVTHAWVSSQEFGPQSTSVIDVTDVKNARMTRFVSGTLGIAFLDDRKVHAYQFALDENEKDACAQKITAIADGSYVTPPDTDDNRTTPQARSGFFPG